MKDIHIDVSEQPLARATISLARATVIAGLLGVVASLIGLAVGSRIVEPDDSSQVARLELEVQSLSAEVSSRNARIERLEKQISAYETEIASLTAKLESTKEATQPGGAPPLPGTGAVSLASFATAREQGIEFDLLACTDEGSSIRCNLMVTNTRDERWFTISSGFRPSTYLVDSGGSSCRGVESTFRSGSVPSEVPFRVTLDFSGCARGVTLLSYLQVGFGVETAFSHPHQVVFRDIPVS